ncbi:MAG: right-handed parallel beta-helix repeat-containing protein [Phycisphaerales bacterium]
MSDVREVVTLHVSPSGNDKGLGTRGRPFGTVERALREARKLKGKGKDQKAVRIVLGGGRYELRKPIVMGVADSGVMRGPNANPKENEVVSRYVSIEAAPGSKGEEPVLSGGRRIRGFRAVSLENGVKAWRAYLPEVKRGKWNFNQLWVNGERRLRPTLPRDFRHEQYRIVSLPGIDLDTAPYDARTSRFEFAEGDIPRGLRNMGDVEMVALHFWISTRRQLKHVDFAERVVTLDAPSRLRLTDDFNKLGAPYYLENVWEALEKPGQWYLDRPAGMLYYLPRKGETPGDTEVIAPVLEQVLTMSGECEAAGDLPRNEGRPVATGKPLDSVRWVGVRFAHTQWKPGDEEMSVTPQSAVHVPGAVNLTHARDCHFIDCAIEHVDGYGVELNAGCMDVTFGYCDVHDVGAGGIKVWHGCRRVDITDCHIHDGGHRHHTGCGVLIGAASGCRVLHNHIHDFDYTGISIGWNWGYASTECFGHVVEYNHVHHIGRGMLSDMGGIYTLGNQVGTRIRFNCFHDIEARGYGGWGIYTDEGSTHILIENNLTYRTKHPGFHQHYGRENIVRNNIFAMAREAHFASTRSEPHVSFFVTNNIFYNASEKVLWGDWRPLGDEMDGNLFWNPRKGCELQFIDKKFTGRAGTARRNIIADPGFKNPAKGDFTLKPDSPAIKLGFRPSDLSTIGPRPRPRK